MAKILQSGYIYRSSKKKWRHFDHLFTFLRELSRSPKSLGAAKVQHDWSRNCSGLKNGKPFFIPAILKPGQFRRAKLRSLWWIVRSIIIESMQVRSPTTTKSIAITSPINIPNSCTSLYETINNSCTVKIKCNSANLGASLLQQSSASLRNNKIRNVPIFCVSVDLSFMDPILKTNLGITVGVMLDKGVTENGGSGPEQGLGSGLIDTSGVIKWD